MNMSDRIASTLIDDWFNLARFDRGEQAKLLRLLKDLEAELIQKLKRIDPTEPTITAFQLRRVERLLEDVRQVIRSAYRQMSTMLRRDLKTLSVAEATGVTALVADLTIVDLFTSLPSDQVLRSLIDDLTLQGHPLQTWWSRQATNAFDRYAAVVRAGVLKGDSINSIVQQLRGTVSQRYRDGAFAGIERNLSTLVRTSIQSVQQQSRLETFKHNRDILRGVEFLTANDEAVCQRCRPYSGMTYTLDHRRLPGTKLPWPGDIPLHPNCRCQWLPLIRAYRDLTTAKGPRFAETVKSLPDDVKAALDGGDGEDLTFPVWLRQQPEAIQKRLLGETRWRLWQAGRLPLTAMVNAATGKPLTLEQLRVRRRRRVA